jgi:hypothetical protein
VAAFGELQAYNSRIEPVGELQFDIAGLDQAVMLTEIIIFSERTMERFGLRLVAPKVLLFPKLARYKYYGETHKARAEVI